MFCSCYLYQVIFHRYHERGGGDTRYRIVEASHLAFVMGNMRLHWMPLCCHTRDIGASTEEDSRTRLSSDIRS